jgi:hypothetical protein
VCGPARQGAVSSVVEHYLDTVGVTGSNPVPRTIAHFYRVFPDLSFAKMESLTVLS